MKFIESNSLNINASMKLLQQIDINTQNHSNPDGFNYSALLLNFKLINHILSKSANNYNNILTTKAIEIFENSIFQITSFKLSNKIIHKEIQDDEILGLSSLLTSVLKNSAQGAKQKSLECLHKIFALYYDNKDFLPLIYQKLFDETNSSLSKTLKANLEACLNNFGYLPNGLAENPVTQFYLKSIRPKLEKANLSKNDNLSLDEAEAEFVYFLLKNNKLTELQADLISLLDFSSSSPRTSKAKSDLVKSFYADFILSNSIEQGNFYYEILEKIYSKESSKAKLQHQKDFANHLLFETLAYLKDGNSEFAISNMLKSIEKRAEFIKDNDSELLKLISGLTNPETLNTAEDGEFKHEIDVKLDADFIPFIELIKQNIRDLLAYETTFKTQRNVLLAKENLIDKYFGRKSANVNLNLGESATENANANIIINNFSVAEKNYYNEKFNNIILNLNQIKYLREKKESEYFSSLKNNDNQSNKYSKFLSSSLSQTNNPANQAAVNEHLEEMKVYIYSRYEDMEKFYFEISRLLRMNFNRIEDFENLKFESADWKQNFLRNLERKIREMSSNYKNLSSENKQLLNFYKSFFDYAENKPIALSSEIILSEDMLNYIENPDFLLKRKIEEADYVGKARDYFRDYYASKVQKRFPRQSFFVLENLDFLKNNLKVDLDNFLIRSFSVDFSNNNNYGSNNKDLNSLKSKIEFYQKNLEFVKQIIAKIPEFGIDSSNYTYINTNNKNDLLLKKLISFETENYAKSSNNTIASTENKPNHLIEVYLKSFSGRISKRLISTLGSGHTARRSRYPFKAINDKNLFKFLFTLNSDNSAYKNVLNSFAEKVIVPAVNSPKIWVYKNVLGQLQNLEQAVKGRNYDEDFAVDDLYNELLKSVNISFNKTSKESAEALKLKEMKDVIDQNFEVFDVKHCVYMIQFGVENNIADGNF